jgi:hypothetical protein
VSKNSSLHPHLHCQRTFPAPSKSNFVYSLHLTTRFPFLLLLPLSNMARELRKPDRPPVTEPPKRKRTKKTTAENGQQQLELPSTKPPSNIEAQQKLEKSTTENSQQNREAFIAEDQVRIRCSRSQAMVDNCNKLYLPYLSHASVLRIVQRGYRLLSQLRQHPS